MIGGKRVNDCLIIPFICIFYPYCYTSFKLCHNSACVLINLLKITLNFVKFCHLHRMVGREKLKQGKGLLSILFWYIFNIPKTIKSSLLLLQCSLLALTLWYVVILLVKMNWKSCQVSRNQKPSVVQNCIAMQFSTTLNFTCLDNDS